MERYIARFLVVSSVVFILTIFSLSFESTEITSPVAVIAEAPAQQFSTLQNTPLLTSTVFSSPNSEQVLNQRFSGLLSHVRWLINNGSASVQGSELIRINKQFESLADDVSDGLRSVRNSNSGSANLTVDENINLNGFYLSGDGDSEGIFIDSAGGVRLSAALLDSFGTAGANGYVLQSSGTSTVWVATSTLGISGTLSNNVVIPDYLLSTGKVDESCLTYEATGDTWEWQICGSGLVSADIDTSAELAAILGDETGTGNVVFSADATLSGTTTLENAYFSGNVGIGTTTLSAKLSIDASGSNVTPLLIKTNGSAGNYTATNSAIFFYDAAGNETLRIFASDPDDINNYNSANLYIGKQAGFNQPTANNSSSGYFNTAVGFESYYSGLSGNYNTSFGYQSLYTNTTGGSNTAIGALALYSNATGTGNVALGENSLSSNVGGQYNSALGTGGLVYNIFGSQNVAVGFKSGWNPDSDTTQYRIVSDTDMVLLGYGATKNNASTLTNGIAIGSGAHVLQSNQVVLGNDSITSTLLKGNVGIGTTTPDKKLNIYADSTAEMSIRSGLTGSANIILTGNRLNDNNSLSKLIFFNQGDDVAQIAAFRDANDDAGALRFYTQANGSSLLEKMRLESGGRLGIGTTTPAQKLQVFGDIRVGTTGSNGCLEDYGGTLIAGTCSSDEQLKTNITPIANNDSDSFMERIAELNVVTYNWNQTASTLYSKNESIENLGLIAQNVEEVFPELISYDDEGYRQVDFRALPFYLIEAVKEIWVKLTNQDERLNDLERENEALKDRLENIESQLNIDTPPPPPAPAPTPDPEPVAAAEEVPTLPEEVAPEEEVVTEEVAVTEPAVEEVLPPIEDVVTAE